MRRPLCADVAGVEEKFYGFATKIDAD